MNIDISCVELSRQILALDVADGALIVSVSFKGKPKREARFRFSLCIYSEMRLVSESVELITISPMYASSIQLQSLISGKSDIKLFVESLDRTVGIEISDIEIRIH